MLRKADDGLGKSTNRLNGVRQGRVLDGEELMHRGKLKQLAAGVDYVVGGRVGRLDLGCVSQVNMKQDGGGRLTRFVRVHGHDGGATLAARNLALVDVARGRGTVGAVAGGGTVDMSIVAHFDRRFSGKTGVLVERWLMLWIGSELRKAFEVGLRSVKECLRRRKRKREEESSFLNGLPESGLSKDPL